jgi:hypothetical protein
MTLLQGLIGARVNETLENFARIEGLLRKEPASGAGEPSGARDYESDEAFWKALVADRVGCMNCAFVFRDLVLSDWVPRVPGLAHKPESRLLESTIRSHHQRVVALDGYKVLQPEEKSMDVMSGVGTLRLAPNTDGEWLVSGSSVGDASRGVPLLVKADVWDRIRGRSTSCEGAVVSGTARWQPMTMEWSTHFRSTGDIPSGYLVLGDPDAIAIHDRGTRTWIFPFTIMEYQSGANELFDYVYCGAHTDNCDCRSGIECFFEAYRAQFAGPHGRYLIAADLVEGLWDAVFSSPADLLARDSSARSQLELLQERVLERTLGETVIQELLADMQSVLHEDDLTRLSDEVGIGTRFWRISNTSLAEQCSQFLAAVVSEKKQDALMERIAVLRPTVIG